MHAVTTYFAAAVLSAVHVEIAFCHRLWQVKVFRNCSTLGGCQYREQPTACKNPGDLTRHRVSGEECRAACDVSPECWGFRSNKTQCRLDEQSLCTAVTAKEGERHVASGSEQPDTGTTDGGVTMENQPVFAPMPDVHSSAAPCWCRPCSKGRQLSQKVEVTTRVREILSDLILEKAALSSSIRKITSAKDERVSSHVIGSVAVVTMVTLFGAVALLDLITLCSKVYRLVLKRKQKNTRK